MAIALELVYEALFLSSIFLMAISLPKIVISILWSMYRVFMYEHAYNWKATRLILSEKVIQESLKPDERLNRLAKETLAYTTELKKPMIELLSALIFLQLSSSKLEVESEAVDVIFILKVAMLAAFILAIVVLALYFLKMRKVKCGGPLA